MTEAQKAWLDEHPNYSVVRHAILASKGWADEGWLYPSGRFSIDDGKTLFVETRNALRVGREYAIV